MTSCVGAIARLSLITAISGNIWYARNMGKFDTMKMTKGNYCRLAVAPLKKETLCCSKFENLSSTC